MIRVAPTDGVAREVARLRGTASSRGAACACAPAESCLATPEPVCEPLGPHGASGGADTCAVIVAGGSGERFGDPRGKQFVDLCGLPLVSWSIMAFDRAASVGHLVVVYPPGRLDDMLDVLSPLTLRCDVTLAQAGATRQDSVFSALIAMPPGFPLVAVHDGARPLVRPETIDAVVGTLRSDPELAGAIAAVRATDTLKLVEDGLIVGTPDRDYYWNAQTPQAFRTKKLLAAHRASVWDDYVGTDDASLIERRGGKVRCVECSRANLKVTVPEDLVVAQALLGRRIDEEGCGLTEGPQGAGPAGAPGGRI